MSKFYAKRDRYIITRNNGSEVWCGVKTLARFERIEDVRNAEIRTFCSKAKAENAIRRCYHAPDECEIRNVLVVMEEVDD